jgi:hypothetical protein
VRPYEHPKLIRIRRDKLKNWVGANPILAEDEPALETDTRRLRIGNGKDEFMDLPYYEPYKEKDQEEDGEYSQGDNE